MISEGLGASAALLWEGGYDTTDIARQLRVTEGSVYNALHLERQARRKRGLPLARKGSTQDGRWRPASAAVVGLRRAAR